MENRLENRMKETLPAKFYTDAKYFTEELEQFYFKRWICVGRTEQIGKPGSYFLAEIGGESIIVTRSLEGKIHAFFNVCRHRGTRLCDKESGSFNGRIACPYHSWTYGLDGRLVGAPHMADVVGFSMDNYSLHAVNCDTWDGHIFLDISKAAGKLQDQLGPLQEKFRAWRSEDLLLGKRIDYTVKANWKLIIQNYSECLHCPVIHPGLKKLTHYLSGDNEPLSPHYLGGSMDLNEGVVTMTATGKTDRQIFSHLSAEQRRHVYYYWVLPNLLLSFHPDYLMTHTLWPRSADVTEVICEWHFHPDEFKRGDFNCEDAVDFWDAVNKEDWHVSELSQLGIQSRVYSPGPYSHRETLLHGLDSILTGGR